jgi:hypothetical protein
MEPSLTIPNLDGVWREVDVTYDYATDPCRCPWCGGLGIAWHGWFHCDGLCQGKALVASGRMFIPVIPVEQ